MLGVTLECIVVSINKQSNSCPEASKYFHRPKNTHQMRTGSHFHAAGNTGLVYNVHLRSQKQDSFAAFWHHSLISLRSSELASNPGESKGKQLCTEGTSNTRGKRIDLHRKEIKLQWQSKCLK